MSSEEKQLYDRNRYLSNRDKIIAQTKAYVQANPDKVKQKQKRWQESNRHKCIDYSKSWRKRNPEKYILTVAKGRAKKSGLEFNLEVIDISIPEYCPILNIKLLNAWDEGYRPFFSPSLDRIDNSKGYIKGNVKVISNKANYHKSNLSLTDIENLYKYSKGEI